MLQNSDLYIFVKHKCPDNGQFQRWPRSKDKYLDSSTCRKILSQEMLMCIMKTLIFII